jgi:hypothetical protein
MPQGTKISFVTWPDGKVDGRSVTLHGETMARENFIATYLPEEWFGRVPTGYVTETLWKGARDKGFRSCARDTYVLRAED